VNTNNGVKWKRFIVPKKVEKINDHLFQLLFTNCILFQRIERGTTCLTDKCQCSCDREAVDDGAVDG